MSFNFTGKQILVTGAGRGIGRAITKALAQSGCKVYALSRTKSTIDSLMEEYPNIVPIKHDLKDWDETRATLEGIETLDGLVNNAAAFTADTCTLKPALDCPKDYIDTSMHINVFAAINCIQTVAKKMIQSKRPGSIVNISSMVSTYAVPNSLEYNVSKAVLDMVTKQFALELGPHNIRVNSVNPTFVEMGKFHVPQEMLAPFIERTPMPGFPTAQHIASTVLYLLSESSAMVTGTTLFVDGGLTCNISTKQ